MTEERKKERKRYAKPVMESEAFQANEYIAWCYSGKCSDHYVTNPFNGWTVWSPEYITGIHRYGCTDSYIEYTCSQNHIVKLYHDSGNVS